MRSPKQLIEDAAIARREGRIEAAEAALIEAVEILRSAGGVDLASTLRSLGEVQRLLPTSDHGVGAYQEAVAMFRAVGDQRRVAHALRHLADIYRSIGQFDAAVGCAEEALEIYRDAAPESPLEEANAFRTAALAHEALGDVAWARRWWGEAEKRYVVAGVREGVEESRARLIKHFEP